MDVGQLTSSQSHRLHWLSHQLSPKAASMLDCLQSDKLDLDLDEQAHLG